VVVIWHDSVDDVKCFAYKMFIIAEQPSFNCSTFSFIDIIKTHLALFYMQITAVTSQL